MRWLHVSRSGACPSHFLLFVLRSTAVARCSASAYILTISAILETISTYLCYGDIPRSMVGNTLHLVASSARFCCFTLQNYAFKRRRKWTGGD